MPERPTCGCDNSIILDITEFKDHVPALYNQSYYLEVHDGGSTLTGNITRFEVGNSSSADVPRLTINNNKVYLTMMNTLLIPEFEVTPTSGPPGGEITPNGRSFTPDRSANISYLNPATSTWVSLRNDTPTDTQGQFTFSLAAPDLLLSNQVGGVTPNSDEIVFQVQDNHNGFLCNTSVPYSEWRRGLTHVGGAMAAGLYGNGTDFSSTVLVETGQALSVEGKWFKPGNVTLFWDGITNVGTAVANATGGFTLAFAVPATVGGRHSLVIIDGNAGFVVSVARMPSTTSNYDGSWRNSDFTVTLTPDPFNSEIYYRVNGGAILRVAADGQPRITTEGDNNTLEYWIVDEFGNEEFPHKMLSQVKLDKTAPIGSVKIGNGGIYNNSASVTLITTGTDLLSGVSQIRFSNDGVWDAEAWEMPSMTKNWTLTTESGKKTVYYQIIDNAGLISLYSASIILDKVKPLVSAGEDQTVTAGSLVTLFAGDCQDNVGISSYNWSFGDGTNGTGVETTHTYSSSGTYAVTLTVQDSAGNTASSSVFVTVQNALRNAIPEFPSFLIIPLLIALPLSALLMKRKSLRH